MYAHKLSTYHDDAYKPVVFCSVCGHEDNLAGPCPGAPTLDMNKFNSIFSEPIKISKELESLVDKTKPYR